MNDRICFTTVAVTSKNYGVEYLRQQDRLVKSIKRVYGDGAEIYQWRDCYPPGSRDWLTSSYCFKPHAVQFAIDEGYTKVCYLDTAMILEQKFNYDGLIESYGVIAAKDDSNLANVTSDLACRYFRIKRSWLEGKNLVGGSIYYFNFANERCKNIFNQWKTAEMNDIFGSQDLESAGKQQGHRHDEACLAICLYLNDSKPCAHDLIGYNHGVMRKEHFR